jgi:hypothetical protein
MPTSITTAQGLQDMNDGLAGDYVLNADIDLSEFSWTRVGNASTPFTGSLNGNGHTISGLTISDPNTSEYGLFGEVNGANIHDLAITGASVTNDAAHTGILIGRIDGPGTTVRRIVIRDSDISNSGGHTGAICGRAINGSIIEDCLIQLNSFTGVFSNDGGIAGSLGSAGGNEIKNSLCVMSNRTSARPVCGSGSGIVTDTIFDSTTAGTSADGNSGSIARTTAQCQLFETYTDTEIVVSEAWDMVLIGAHDGDIETAVWAIDDGEDYPVLYFEIESDDLKIEAQRGSYVISGKDASLLSDRIVDAEKGSYSITGKDVSLLADRIIEANKGSYEISGKTALLVADLVLSAQKGEYTIGGKDASLIVEAALTLLAEKGTYSLGGKQVSLNLDRILSAERGSYVFSGKDASFLVGIILSAQKGNYTLEGKEADFFKDFLIKAQKGEYVITPKTAALLYDRIFSVDKGEYVLTGKDANLFITDAATIIDEIFVSSIINEEILLSSTIHDVQAYSRIRDIELNSLI